MTKHFEPRPWDEPHILFLTLVIPPKFDEEIILECQGKVVPRDKWNLLTSMDTGEQHVYMRDATWGDCCQASVRYRVIPRTRRRDEKTMSDMTTDPNDIASVEANTPAQAPARPGAIALAALAAATKVGEIRLYNAAEDVRIIEAEFEALRERVVELEAIKNDWIEAGKLRGIRADQAEARAEAAEAGRAELAGALEDYMATNRPLTTTQRSVAFKARAALAATPEEVMERRQSEKMLMDKLARVARAFLATGFGNTEDRFAARDALDALKEGG